MIELTYKHGDTSLVGSFYPVFQAPTLILFPAFEGPSEFCHHYAQQLNQAGFSVFIADMYGSKKQGNSLEECLSLVSPFLESRQMARQRAFCAFEACSKLKGVDPKKMGALGFCFGGLCTLELARSGAPLKGFVTLHGLLTASELKTHPIQGEIFILHGFKDPQVPPNSLNEFAHEMENVDCDRWQFLFFGDAKHAFTDPKTGSFDPKQEKLMGREYNQKVSLRSFEYVKNFFHSLF
jgi:dienelactone hydrolase